MSATVAGRTTVVTARLSRRRRERRGFHRFQRAQRRVVRGIQRLAYFRRGRAVGQLAPNEAPVLRLVPFNGPTLLAGQMADLARVETSSRPPIRFDLAAGTAPALRIGLAPTKRGVTLTVEYGNRRAVAVLRR